ncbi:MAG: type II toxin-antitoxin system Phd/YefM family antitoxin [Planctomycetes bacterium]|nr:type II toxin-antitoxin system Phd/YefM family antitoxin [Planctomycetota bacterium]
MARPLASRRPGTLARRRVRRLTSTEVQRNFAEVLNRVRYQGETVLVERGGEDVCEIIPPEHPRKFTWNDLAALLDATGSAGEEWATAVEHGIRNQPPAEFKKWPR